MLNLIKNISIPKRKFEKSLVIAGILHGERAYIGPEVLHIDLTNECNNNCIGCWCRSPLLKDKEMPEWEKKQTLPFSLIKQVLDDLHNLGGLRQVKLVGGGEPFMHPNILDIIEYIKSKDKNISIDINTNFTLVNEDIAKELIRLSVDTMTVSIWAGDANTYVRTHTSKREEDFLRMAKMLKLIASVKNGKPWIKIYNVISRLNYDTTERMLEFALEVKANDVQFVLLDPIPERTDCLLLNQEESREFLEILLRIKKNYNSGEITFTNPQTGQGITITELDGLIRRLTQDTSSLGIYDEKVVQEIPCYVGWLFARIVATGDVVPCCKGHRLVMGNVYKQSFKKIWHSSRYQEFRYNAKNFSKSRHYFSKIGNDVSQRTGCYNCDNLWQNEPMHKLIMSLPIQQRKKWLGLFSYHTSGNPA